MNNKKGNSLVDLSVFRNRVEKVTQNANQNEIEEVIGIRYGELSNVYNGHAALTIDLLIRLSNAYHCSVDYLLGRDDIANRNSDELTAYDFIYTMAVAQDMGAIEMDEFSWDRYERPGEIFEIPNGVFKMDTVVIKIVNSKLNENLKLLRSLLSIGNDTEELRGEILSMWLNRLKEKRISISGSDMVPLKKGD